MKICWWTLFPTPNECALVKALRSLGTDVVVCYFRKYDAYRKMIGWLERPLEAHEHFAPTIRSARRQISDFDERIQVVPSFSDGISWRLMAWSIVHRRPWIASVERSRARLRSWPFRKAFALLVNRYALKLFCIGKLAVEQFAALGVCRRKLAWIAYAMPAIRSEILLSRKRHGGVRFAFVGALMEHKAVDVLAAAFPLVRAAHGDASLKIVGEGPLRNLFAGMDGVEMLGTVAPGAVAGAVSDCDVIVLPSRCDAWGIALVEGAAMGMAMIAGDRVGASELVSDSPRNGFVVKSGDVESLAAAMMRYAESPALDAEHGANARLVMRIVGAEAVADRIINALGEALAEDGDRR